MVRSAGGSLGDPEPVEPAGRPHQVLQGALEFGLGVPLAEQGLHVLDRATQLVQPVLQAVELGTGDQDDVAGQAGLRRRGALLVGPLPAGLTTVLPRAPDRPLLGQHPAAPAAPALAATPPPRAGQPGLARRLLVDRPDRVSLCHAAHGRRRDRHKPRNTPGPRGRRPHSVGGTVPDARPREVPTRARTSGVSVPAWARSGTRSSTDPPPSPWLTGAGRSSTWRTPCRPSRPA